VAEAEACMPSFILIHPTVWPQYTNVRDGTGQTDWAYDGLIAYGEPFLQRAAMLALRTLY